MPGAIALTVLGIYVAAAKRSEYQDETAIIALCVCLNVIMTKELHNMK